MTYFTQKSDNLQKGYSLITKACDQNDMRPLFPLNIFPQLSKTYEVFVIRN